MRVDELAKVFPGHALDAPTGQHRVDAVLRQNRIRRQNG
jgi:hypothetical protein